MERLWEELSRQPHDIPVPDWQIEILSERIASVREGRAKFQDWDEAKTRLRERCDGFSAVRQA